MKEKYQTNVAVFLILFKEINKDTKILMQKRSNTGWMDGMYDFACSGYLESDESVAMAICREAKEEIGVDIKEEDVKLIFLCHPYKTKKDHIDIFFTCKKYEGMPKIMEPKKCEDLKWFSLKYLPKDIIPELQNVILSINKGIIYDDDRFRRSNN